MSASTNHISLYRAFILSAPFCVLFLVETVAPVAGILTAIPHCPLPPVSSLCLLLSAVASQHPMAYAASLTLSCHSTSFPIHLRIALTPSLSFSLLPRLRFLLHSVLCALPFIWSLLLAPLDTHELGTLLKACCLSLSPSYSSSTTQSVFFSQLSAPILRLSSAIFDRSQLGARFLPRFRSFSGTRYCRPAFPFHTRSAFSPSSLHSLCWLRVPLISAI